jgi:hypothetical protein
MKRISLAVLVQITSGLVLSLLGVGDMLVGTISCSLFWLVCCHDATYNFYLFPEKENNSLKP